MSRDEQKLFRRPGVFTGGWSLEAAEAVCDRGDLSLDVLGGLASLVDKSLMRAVERVEERFFMPATWRMQRSCLGSLSLYLRRLD